jgi:hypothetical protein
MVLPYEARPAPPPSALAGLCAAPLLLVVGGLAAVAVFQRPEPVLGGAPASGQRAAFPIARALHVLDWLTDEPRPVGSEAHDRVRAQLIAEIRAAGLAPEIQAGEVNGTALANVLARLPGRGAQGAGPWPAVLVVCHYDSRPETPGAADDGAAVAASLATLELLAREPPLWNDIVFLFTDGEELGLLGALLFASEHPWMAGVRALLNFDAIGNDGPPVMFQTGPGSRELVELFAAHAPHPVGSSLAPVVYRLLPNDTDFSIFQRRNLPGLNFALVGGKSAYHQPSDTWENLDRGSLQLLGDTLLALTRALGDADLADLAREDATYFALLGRLVVRYSHGATLAIGLASLAWVVFALRASGARRGLGVRFLGAGTLLAVSVLAAVGLTTDLAFLIVERVAPLLSLAPPPPAPSNLVSGSWTLVGLALVATAAFSTALEYLRTRDDSAEATAAGGLVPWAALVLAFTLLEPLAAAELTPALALAALPLYLRRAGATREVVAWISAAGAWVLTAPVLALGFHLLARKPAVAALLASFALPALLLLAGPLFAWIVHGRLTRVALAVLGLGALGVGAWMRLGPS